MRAEVSILHGFLTIIPRARKNSEAMTARGIIVFSKIQLVGKNIETKQLWLVKARL